MAELMWRDAGCEITVLPADWSAHRGAAGFQWNQERVGAAQVFHEAGAQVLCTAFLDLCRKPGCPEARSEARSSSCRMHRGTSRTAPSTAGLERELRGSRRPT